jgi:hypothetical protein
LLKKKGSSRKEGKTPAKRVRAERRCDFYSEIRHISRTCKVVIEDIDNSSASKECYPVAYSIAICCIVALRYCVDAAPSLSRLLA